MTINPPSHKVSEGRRFIRKLQKNGTHSYTINIPKSLVKAFGWKERQKLELSFGGRKKELKLKDWQKN